MLWQVTGQVSAQGSSSNARIIRLCLFWLELGPHTVHVKYSVIFVPALSTANPSHIYPYLKRFMWLRSKHSWSHSWWKMKGMFQTLALNMPRMRNSNIEIRIAGSSLACNYYYGRPRVTFPKSSRVIQTFISSYNRKLINRVTINFLILSSTWISIALYLSLISKTLLVY